MYLSLADSTFSTMGEYRFVDVDDSSAVFQNCTFSNIVQRPVFRNYKGPDLYLTDGIFNVWGEEPTASISVLVRLRLMNPQPQAVRPAAVYVHVMLPKLHPWQVLHRGADHEAAWSPPRAVHTSGYR